MCINENAAKKPDRYFKIKDSGKGPNGRFYNHSKGAYSPKGSVSHVRSYSSIGRSKNSLKDAVFTNAEKFVYAVTFTADRKKQKRYDPCWIQNNLRDYLDEKQKEKPEKIYVVSIERHEDGAYHGHGVLSQAFEDELIPVLPEEADEEEREQINQGRDVYRWPDAIEKFGRRTMVTRINNIDRVVNYMVENFTVKTRNSMAPYNTPAFFCSEGLPRSKVEITLRVQDDDFERTAMLYGVADFDYTSPFAQITNYSPGSLSFLAQDCIIKIITGVFECSQNNLKSLIIRIDSLKLPKTDYIDINKIIEATIAVTKSLRYDLAFKATPLMSAVKSDEHHLYAHLQITFVKPPAGCIFFMDCSIHIKEQMEEANYRSLCIRQESIRAP